MNLWIDTRRLVGPKIVVSPIGRNLGGLCSEKDSTTEVKDNWMLKLDANLFGILQEPFQDISASVRVPGRDDGGFPIPLDARLCYGCDNDGACGTLLGAFAELPQRVCICLVLQDDGILGLRTYSSITAGVQDGAQTLSASSRTISHVYGCSWRSLRLVRRSGSVSISGTWLLQIEGR
jgi:hypothetical protein